MLQIMNSKPIPFELYQPEGDFILYYYIPSYGLEGDVIETAASGYFCIDGTLKNNSIQASVYNTTEHQNNLILKVQKWSSILGTIQLPEGEIAKEDIEILIEVMDSETGGFRKYVTIKAGVNSINYALPVPVGRYKLTAYKSDQADYESNLYYSESNPEGAIYGEETYFDVSDSMDVFLNLITLKR